jgi:hypothetical protein
VDSTEKRGAKGASKRRLWIAGLASLSALLLAIWGITTSRGGSTDEDNCRALMRYERRAAWLSRAENELPARLSAWLGLAELETKYQGKAWLFREHLVDTGYLVKSHIAVTNHPARHREMILRLNPFQTNTTYWRAVFSSPQDEIVLVCRPEFVAAFRAAIENK